MRLSERRCNWNLDSCYSWEFRDIGDHRRHSIWGRGDNKLCATGMWLTCRPFPSAELLPGSRDHPTICWKKSAVECQPKKLAEAAAAAASDDAAGSAAAKEEEEQDPLQEHMLNLQTQYYEDWKMFYRSAMPEKTKGSVYSARVARTMKGMGIYANQLKETTAHRSAMELQASSDRAAKTLDEGGSCLGKGRRGCSGLGRGRLGLRGRANSFKYTHICS